MKLSILLVLLTFTLTVQADDDKKLPAADPSQTDLPAKLTFIKNYSGSNEVKLLNNRFRVDHHVDEVMMLFFRKEGSAPVVLIRPDGSKIYPKDANAKTIEWQAELGYDLIRLQDPTPGPWQAVGRILPDSKIMVLSDIELQVDPLPNEIFQYEVLKTEARITNANEMIKDGNIRKVVTLKASLYPSNDPNASNFGSDIYRVGEFKDNGKDLDERPRDGVFTLQYYIQTAHGLWSPKFRVLAELFTRELTQEPILVKPSPISFVVDKAVAEERYHYVSIDVNEDGLDNLSLVLQGRVEYPNGDIETFSLQGTQERKVKIFNGEFGRFNVELEVFGNTLNGREFKLLIPPYQFVTLQPEQPKQEVELPPMTELPAEPAVIIKKEPPFPVALVVLTNIVIFAIGFLVIWLFVLKRSIPNPFSKLFKKKEPKIEEPEEVKKEEKKPEKVNSPPTSDDILDLSLPED